MQESIQFESEEDFVIGHLGARDHLFVDIESQDLWLKVFLTMNSEDYKCSDSEFEMKMDNKMNGKELKYVI